MMVPGKKDVDNIAPCHPVKHVQPVVAGKKWPCGVRGAIYQ